MIAANEQVARLLAHGACPRCTACTSGPTGCAAERLIDQLASLGVPTPPVPKGHITPQQAADLIGEASQLVERLDGVAGRAGAPGAHEPRAALAQAGVLRPAQPRPRRPPARELLPLHLADPALPRPDLPPGAAVRGGRATSRRPTRPGSARPDRGARRASARRCRSSAMPTTSPAASCSSGRCVGRTRTRRSRARSSDSPAPARSWRSGRAASSRACSRSGCCAATGGSSTSRARCSSGPAAAPRSALGDPVQVRVGSDRRAAGRVDLLPGWEVD